MTGRPGAAGGDKKWRPALCLFKVQFEVFVNRLEFTNLNQESHWHQKTS